MNSERPIGQFTLYAAVGVAVGRAAGGDRSLGRRRGDEWCELPPVAIFGVPLGIAEAAGRGEFSGELSSERIAWRVSERCPSRDELD